MIKSRPPTLCRVLLAASFFLCLLTTSVEAQRAAQPSVDLASNLTGDIKALLLACVRSADGHAKAELNDQIAQSFQSTFKSVRPVVAEARVIKALKVKGCSRMAITISMPGQNVKDTQGKLHPVVLNGEMNYCIDGSMPGQEQL